MCRNKEGHHQFQAALERMRPVLLDTFGRSDSERSEQYITYGQRIRTYKDARERFARRARLKLEALGLNVPSDEANRKFL